MMIGPKVHDAGMRNIEKATRQEDQKGLFPSAYN